jgi:hypothetical protein
MEKQTNQAINFVSRLQVVFHLTCSFAHEKVLVAGRPIGAEQSYRVFTIR